jgi:iron complex outermembrane recepter protein
MMKIDTMLSRSGLAVCLAIASQTPAHAAENKSVDQSTLDSSNAQLGEIIVTGTRASGITAPESPTPIKVLSADAIQHVGQPNLNQVLTQLVPSFTAQAIGADLGNLTLSARLRGLSPNHALILVNGKRRHGTANVAIISSPFQGSAAPDLDLISPSSIKRVEVLEDGAAAQYGSDAIAGVINIILKNDAEGVSGSLTGGKNYDVGGDTYAGTVHLATKLGDDGFANVTIFHRYHNFTQIGGLDNRVTDPSGAPQSSLSAAQRAIYETVAGYPYVNPLNGDARSHLTNVQYNSGYDVGSVSLYSFGSYSHRIAESRANVRLPDRIIASPVLGVSGVLGAPGSILFAPTGFVPRLKIREDDYSITGGMKGDLAGFSYDLSTTYGVEKDQIYTINTANRSLFIDTHTTPTDFYNGNFKATEWTSNADFTREIDIGLTEPLNLAFGAEYRWNQYVIGAGETLSFYKEGEQAYPGFRPTDAGTHSRDSQSVYLDIALNPLEKLKFDGAVRYEHYSDFGSKIIFKGTSRYDLSDAFAVRGTVSTGFRAPTLAESYYSATTVSTQSAFVQLPANSAAAKLLGFRNLKPEKSTNFSAGVVVRPAPRLSITLDAYQISVRDRILGTGSIFGRGGATVFPIVTDAIIANGNVLDPTVPQTGIAIFTNGASTRTRGIDLTMSYPTNFDSLGKVDWTIAANYNRTKATRVYLAPSQLTPVGATQPISLFNATTISNLERASPRVKVVGSANWTLGRFSVVLRETLYGKSSQDLSPNGGTFYRQTIKTAAITDIEAGFRITDNIDFSIGANNLLNKRPPHVQVLSATTIADGKNVFDAPLLFSPYGINGGYYYGRINFKF